jgi:hypothetical protein
MRRKLLELGIVSRVKAAVRNQEDLVSPRGIGQLANVRQQFLCSGYVELATGQHEISLNIYFPKDEVAG